MPENNDQEKDEKILVSLRLSVKVVSYFKEMSVKTGIPYQTLINLFLCDCVEERKQIGIVNNQF